MKNVGLSLLVGLVIWAACSPKLNTTSKVDREWVALFNGKNLDNWIAKIHHHPAGDNFGNTFRAEDNMIKVRYDEYGADFNDQFGHLFYETPFSHYHLKLEYHFSGALYPGAPSYTIK